MLHLDLCRVRLGVATDSDADHVTDITQLNYWTASVTERLGSKTYVTVTRIYLPSATSASRGVDSEWVPKGCGVLHIISVGHVHRHT